MALDRNGQEGLFDVLTDLWKEIALPIHMLSSVVAMLPKAWQAWRPIALLHMLYRWWANMLRPEITCWDNENAGPCDSAVRGKGAGAESFDEETITCLHIIAGGVTSCVLLGM